MTRSQSSPPKLARNGHITSNHPHTWYLSAVRDDPWQCHDAHIFPSISAKHTPEQHWKALDWGCHPAWLHVEYQKACLHAPYHFEKSKSPAIKQCKAVEHVAPSMLGILTIAIGLQFLVCFKSPLFGTITPSKTPSTAGSQPRNEAGKACSPACVMMADHREKKEAPTALRRMSGVPPPPQRQRFRCVRHRFNICTQREILPHGCACRTAFSLPFGAIDPSRAVPRRHMLLKWRSLAGPVHLSACSFCNDESDICEISLKFLPWTRNTSL